MRVIVVGGGGAGTQATVQTVNVLTLAPSWGPVSTTPDGRGRVDVSTVLLPDGTVFVAGGTQTGPHTSYIYDPDTAVSPWRRMDELNAPRHYPQCLLLLPSGKVMAAGGASPGGCTASVENTVEVFSPPYLFNDDGSPADRPEITKVNSTSVDDPDVAPTVHHGASFVFKTPRADAISKVVLVRPMAVTHQTDTQQRILACEFAQIGNGRLRATAPNGGHPHSLAPRGYYMLFILNAQGTPSVGRFVHLHYRRQVPAVAHHAPRPGPSTADRSAYGCVA